MNERTIFLEALEQPTPERRQAFLTQACGGNARLLQQIEDLLQAHNDAGSFIEHSPAGVATTSLAGLPQSDTDDPTAVLSSGSSTPKSNDFNLSFLSPSHDTQHLGRLGTYEILDVIGRGAFGIVLRALDPKLNRVVAIKVLLPELAANAMSVRRFLKEAQAAAAVSHDHVVTIYAVDDSNPLPFLVMECIIGQSLQQNIDKQGALPVNEILRIGMQVASGLAAAHKQGLVHRDIKPGNILLENSVQRVKITDFGLARAVDDLASTQTFQVAGTPQYMSPEQTQGTTIDQRSDLFSLGSVLYTMCTGRAAFRADSIMAVLKRVCDDTPRPIREVNPDIPEWLEAIVNKLLEKKPEDRYQTAAEVAELLGNHLAELQQHPSSTTPMASMKSSHAIPARSTKNRWSPTAVVLVGLVVLVCLMAFPWVGALGLFGFVTTGSLPTSKTPQNDVISKAPLPESRPSEMPLKDSSATGWHGWPADAPSPAIAPFDAEQAKAHQEMWAKYLKVPVEHTNSIGMKFVLIPPGEFLMGSSAEEVDAALVEAAGVEWWKECIRSEAPQHKVIVMQPFFLGAHEVTQAQYEQVMGLNPSHFAPFGAGKDDVAGLDTTRHPVEMVSWSDAGEFCAKLSQSEHLQPFNLRTGYAVPPPDGTGYRLPTEAEWEYSCRVGTTTRYWIGDKDEYLPLVGWLMMNSRGRTHPVGELLANPFGVYDIHGNVWEWVQDRWQPTYYGQIRGKQELESNDSSSGNSPHVLRGGWWTGAVSRCRAAYRNSASGPGFGNNIGFRVALPVDSAKQMLNDKTAASEVNTGWPVDAPPTAIAPFDAEQAKAHQEMWAKYLKVPVEHTNSIGMKFVFIPPGEFLMGTPMEEVGRWRVTLPEHAQGWVDSEAPIRRVVIEKPFYLGCHEATLGQFEKFVSETNYRTVAETNGKGGTYAIRDGNPEKGWVRTGPEFTWRYSTREVTGENAVGTLAPNDIIAFIRWLNAKENLDYRVPTEAQWEYACRAGTITPWCCRKEDLPNVGWYDVEIHPVGQKRPNPFGLYDMYGNMQEPTLNGENWVERGIADPNLTFVRSAARFPMTNTVDGSPYFINGMRIATTVESVKKFLHGSLPVSATEPDNVNSALSQTSTVSDPDRAAAEYVLSVGGEIKIKENGEERKIGTVSELPRGEFELAKVDLSKNQMVSDAGLAVFENCKNLTDLILSGTNVSKTGLSHFRNCQKLQILGLGETEIGNAGLAHFKECKSLTGIWLYSTLVSDAGLSDTISKMPDIRILHMSNSRVTDAGLAHLKSCRALTSIIVSGCDVSDAGLEHLANCPMLDSVYVKGTKVTEAGVKKFSAAFPKCTIKWNGGVIEP